MSRIHDALKKAEQERNSVPTPDATIPQAGPTGIEHGRNERFPVAVADKKSSASVSVPPSQPSSERYLRFDELMARCAHPRWQLDPSVNVFNNDSAGARGAEQFRTLRSRLYQLRNNQEIRTLLVTSAVPAEGKTFVAGNLAQAIVRQPDRRVLLIDADVRCARLHLALGAPSTPGLTNYLRGEVDEAAVIQCAPGSNLCLIPGGSEVTDPSELLSNGRIKTLLDRVAPVFDWIIFDSAPCLPVADATILANCCDAVLLVVRAGVTSSDVAQRAVQEFQDYPIAGVVLNAAEEAGVYGSYYQEYGYSAGASK